ncbi:MAG: PHP-associated domain-containing protein [Longimicrobiales bacterium]
MAGDRAARGHIRVDLHIHTNASFDCLTDPVRLVEHALSIGLDRIGITDHNELYNALMLKERYPDRIVVGEEVKTAEGVDVIGYFIERPIPKGTPARATCERIREQGGVVYVPHPFAAGKGGGGRILEEIHDLVDAVEAFNARIHAQALNERAEAWARERGLPVGAGSDAHTLDEVGRAYVELPPFDDTRASFLAALRAGSVHGTESPRRVHLSSTWAKLRRKLPGGAS